jgi:hypothetical protein
MYIYYRGPQWEEMLGDHSDDAISVAGERAWEEIDWVSREIGSTSMSQIVEYLVNAEPPLSAEEAIIFFAGARVELPVEA